MAYAFKQDGIWYVRYKNEAGKWRRKSCGKKANSTDADYLAKQYTSKELNRFHNAPVRIITSNLCQAPGHDPIQGCRHSTQYYRN